MDPIVKWTKALSGTITGYLVQWTRNGANAGSLPVPQTSAGDSGGYLTDFSSANPGITLAPKDVIGVSVETVDATDNLASAFVASLPATVTIPVVAPGVPQNVVLSLT